MLKNLKKILTALFIIITPAFSAVAAVPENTAQLITANPSVSRMIIWQTTEIGSEHHVEYKRQNSRVINYIAADTVSIPNFDNSAPKFRHSAYLENLQSGEDYLYRTVSDNRASAWFKMTALPADSFKALLFGDSQSVNYTVWGDTLAAARQNNPDADFFINMGDLVDNGQHAWQWSEWFKNSTPLMRTIPLAPISGNHENYSIDWQFTTADVYNTLFPLPRNGAPDLQNQTYSFDAGDVHFVVLDTQLEELAAWQPDLFIIQQAWLKKDLSATDKRWKIILMHRNPLTHDGKDTPTEVGLAFMPLFEKYNVDIVFYGHIHTYGRTMPLKNGKSDKNGVIYIATGRSGDDVWPVPKQKRTELVFDAQLDQTNYLTITQTRQTLTVQDYQLDGTLRDELTLTK